MADETNLDESTPFRLATVGKQLFKSLSESFIHLVVHPNEFTNEFVTYLRN